MAMLSKTIKTQTRTFEDGSTALDVRTFRKFEGARDLRPGKGLSVGYSTPAELRAIVDALKADLERECKRVERAAKKVAVAA